MNARTVTTRSAALVAAVSAFLVGAGAHGQEIIRSYPNVWIPGHIGPFDCIGDVDRDGFPDLIAGDPNFDISMTGLISVLSGETGRILYSYAGAAPLDYLGLAVAGIGDMSGDLVPDFMGSGRTGHVWSSKDGSLIANLGYFLVSDSLGDINGDGILDFVQAYYFFLGPGKATVYLGGTFEEVYSIDSPPSSVIFGRSIAAIGDVDADGVADFAVGAPGDPIDFVCVPGEVFVYSGKDGHFLY